MSFLPVWCTPVFIFHWFLLLSRLCEPFCKKRDGTREFQGRKRDRFSTISHLLSILIISRELFFIVIVKVVKDLVTQGGPRSLFRWFSFLGCWQFNSLAELMFMILTMLTMLTMWTILTMMTIRFQGPGSPSPPCDPQCLHHLRCLRISHELMMITTSFLWSYLLDRCDHQYYAFNQNIWNSHHCDQTLANAQNQRESEKILRLIFFERGKVVSLHKCLMFWWFSHCSVSKTHW